MVLKQITEILPQKSVIMYNQILVTYI